MEKNEQEQYLQIGEKIKRLREDNNLTLKDMAERTGLSTAVLSQIENHLISPPLGTLIRLTQALDLRPGYFFDQHPDKPFTLVRKEERRPVSRFASKRGIQYGYSYESLGHEMKDRHMEPFLVTLGEHSDVLQPGDAIYYDSNIPHLVQCRGNEKALILAVIYSG